MQLRRYHFDLTKFEFCDGIALRYFLNPVKTPPLCACIENSTVAYALHCQKRGYKHMRQNELSDSIATLLSDVGHGVDIEPHFQPSQRATIALQSTTTDDDARCKIRYHGQRTLGIEVQQHLF